jgi:hypothetical protein
LPSRIIPGFLVPILRGETPLILGFFIIRAAQSEIRCARNSPQRQWFV